MPSLKGKGDRRQAVEGFPTETLFHNISTSRNNPSVKPAHCQAQHKARPPAALQGSL